MFNPSDMDVLLSKQFIENEINKPFIYDELDIRGIYDREEEIPDDIELSDDEIKTHINNAIDDGIHKTLSFINGLIKDKETITLYRGTSVDETKSEKIGMYWTYDLKYAFSYMGGSTKYIIEVETLVDNIDINRTILEDIDHYGGEKEMCLFPNSKVLVKNIYKVIQNENRYGKNKDIEKINNEEINKEYIIDWYEY